MKLVYKQIGETPLECLRRHIPSDKKARYIGRLDPMAEGELLLLEGEECKDSATYLATEKRYQYRAVLGIETDSLDMLGLVLSSASVSPRGVQERVEQYVGEVAMYAPLYSGHTVQGKKLFWYANNALPVTPPLLHNTIYSHVYKGDAWQSGAQIATEALRRIRLVKGSFRQEECSGVWERFRKEYGTAVFFTYEAEVHVSSGTYVRAIVREIAASLGVVGMASAIQRTSILL